jgi:hypothetical protein
MNRGSSVRQCGQTRRSACDGGVESSPPQTRHLKYIIVSMKLLIVMLLLAASVHAQTLADAAKKERERQSKSRSTRVIISTGTISESKPITASAEQPKAEQAKATDAKAAETKGAAPEPSKELPKAQVTAAADPIQVWNNQLNQLRSKIRGLQDQEMTLLLQQNQITNQVYAPVTDPATQERSLAQLGQIQQQIAAVRKDLDEAKKMLDSMQLQGPPKK